MPGVCIYQRFMPPDVSGAGKQALTLAHVVREAGWDVVLLTDGDPALGPSLEGFPVRRVEPLPPDASYRQLLAYWTRIARALADMRSRFDVLHIHTAHFRQAGAVPVARMLGKRVVVRSSISGEFAEFGRSRSGRAQKQMLRLADAFVVLSERLASEYIDSGLPRSKLNLIPNGVDTNLYRPATRSERLALRGELCLPLDSRIAVYHGVFIERKSLHWIVDVLASRLRELNLTLLLVGGPAREESATGYAARLEAQIANSPERDRIIVRPHDPAVHKYLQAADAYILASTGEGLPNALLEAMASGLIAIVSRTSGSEDVIADGVSGYLFEPRQAESLTRCIDEVFGTPRTGTIEAITQAAVQRVRDHFSIAATGRQYVDVYSALLHQPWRER